MVSGKSCFPLELGKQQGTELLHKKNNNSKTLLLYKRRYHYELGPTHHNVQAYNMIPTENSTYD